MKVEKSKITTTTSYLIEIGDQASAWISKIRVPFSKSTPSTIEEAVILNQQGTILRQLKKSEIITKSDISSNGFYEDDFVYEFDLRWNTYPYRIRYSYKTTYENYLSIARWTPFEDAYVENAQLTVQAPIDFPMRIQSHEAITFDSDTLENEITSTWRIQQISPFKSQTFSPPIWDCAPHVTILPNQFIYGLPGSMETWKDFGKWMFQTIQGLEQLPLSEQILINNQLRGIEDPEQKIEVLYQYLQKNTRYIYVALGIGGMKPHSAEYVSTKRYGDCKALTIYMKALLNQIGIDSYYTLVSAGDNPEQSFSKFPGQHFNHVILCVPRLNGDTLWLENTASYLPAGYLGTFTQGRSGLVVNSTGGHLINIPNLDSQEVLVATTYQITTSPNGNGAISGYQRAKGELFEDYLYAQSGLSKDDQKKMIEDRLSIPGSDLYNWQFKQSTSDKESIELSFEATGTPLTREVGSNLIVRSVPFNIPKMEAPEKRIQDVRIPLNIHRIDTCKFRIYNYSDYQFTRPTPINIESNYGSFSSQVFETNDGPVIVKEILLNAGNYPVSEYSNFYTFISKIAEADKLSLYLKKSP